MTKKPSLRKLDKAWADEIKKRDNYKCAVCGNTKTLNSHHILPKHGYKEYRHDLKNGITLCVTCHKFGRNSAHKNALAFTEFIAMYRTDQYYYLMEKIHG